MKDLGWTFCSGIISDCPPGRPIVGWEFYTCRQQSKEPHWHKVFEASGEKVVIEWEIMYKGTEK